MLLFVVSWVIWVFRVDSHEHSCGAIREILSDVGMSLILVIHLTILSVDPIITIGLFLCFVGVKVQCFSLLIRSIIRASFSVVIRLIKDESWRSSLIACVAAGL